MAATGKRNGLSCLALNSRSGTTSTLTMDFLGHDGRRPEGGSSVAHNHFAVFCKRLKNICALLEVCDAVAFMQARLYKFGAFILMKLQNWVRSSLCSSTVWKIHVLAVLFCLSEQNNSHLFHKMNSENNLTCKPHQISSLNLLSDKQCPWHI